MLEKDALLDAPPDTSTGGADREARRRASIGNGARRRALGSIAWVTASNYATSAIAIVRGVVFAGMLGPSGYGMWGLISTFQGWSQHADLGVAQVAVREMPRGAGTGDPDRARAYARSSFWWAMICSAAAGLMVAGVWGFSGWPNVPARWVLFPLLFVGMNAFAIGGQIGRGFFSFRRVALITVVASAFGLGCGYVATARFGLAGLLASQAIIYALAAVPLLGSAGPGSVLHGLDWTALRGSLVSGWSLLLPSVTMQVFVSLDVVMAGVLLGTAQTGLYAVALLSSAMVAGILATSASSVVGQYVLRDSVRCGAVVRPRQAIVWGPAAGVALVLAPACAVMVFVGPILLRLVLPEYSGSVLPMQILLVAAYFLYSQVGFSTTLVATGKQLHVVPLYVGLSAANIAIDVVLVRAGWGIAGIAAGTLIVNAAFAVAHLRLVAHAMGSTGRRVVMQAAASLPAGLLPASAVLAANGALSRFVGVGVGGFSTALSAAVGLASWGVLTHVARAWLSDLSGREASPHRKSRGGERAHVQGARLRLANDALNRVESRLARSLLVSAPLEVVIEPTNDCNGRCLMCLPFRRDARVPHAPMGYMDMRTLERLAPALSGARRVLFGGFGEPLLHPDYVEMLRWVKQRGPFVYAFTNGALVTSQLASELVDAGIDDIVVSIGGATECTYQRVRGVRFGAVRRGLESIVEAKAKSGSSTPTLRFNVVQMNSVLPEMGAIIDLASTFGVGRIDMPQMWVESAPLQAESVLTNPDARPVLEEARNYARRHGVELRICDLPPSGGECRSAWSSLMVGFDGEAYSCAAERYRMGNVNEEPVMRMWRSGSFATLRAMLRDDARGLCPHCPVIEPEAFTNPALHGRFIAEPFDALSGPSRVRDERVCDEAREEGACA